MCSGCVFSLPFIAKFSGPCNRCHAIKLKLNARSGKEKHFRANHDTAEVKHSTVCVRPLMPGSLCGFDLP